MANLVHLAELLQLKQAKEVQRIQSDAVRQEHVRDAMASLGEVALRAANNLVRLRMEEDRRVRLANVKATIEV